MSLKNYFPPSTHPDKIEFDALLDLIYASNHFFAYITHYPPGKFYHTSPSIETITGYTAEQFEAEGVSFFVSRIPHEDTLAILQTQGDYFKRLVEPDFDRSVPEAIDMTLRLVSKNGSIIPLVGSGMPLGYLQGGGLDFALLIAYPKQSDELEEKKLNTEVHILLTKVKLLHNRIFGLPKVTLLEEDIPVEIVSARDQRHILTVKEKEVLKKIAQGKSSKEIADALSISENTVETHRKNMMGKFEAKNIAELIKKASKLYWLD